MKITITTQTIEEAKKLFGKKTPNLLMDIIEDKDFMFSTITDSVEISIEDFTIGKKVRSSLKYLSTAEEAIRYLNEMTGKKFSTTTASNTSLVIKLLKANYTIDQIKTVIRVKTNSWACTNMEAYLRPQTLFGSKFEAYLNESDSQLSLSEKKLADKLEKYFEN